MTAPELRAGGAPWTPLRAAPESLQLAASPSTRSMSARQPGAPRAAPVAYPAQKHPKDTLPSAAHGFGELGFRGLRRTVFTTANVVLGQEAT